MVFNLIVTLLISFGIIVGTVFYIKKIILKAHDTTSLKVVEDIKVLEEKLKHNIQDGENLVSKLQLKTLSERLDKLATELESAKQGLTEIENKLDESQATVEKKESQQQDLKSTTAEDEAKINELLSSYQGLADEATHLEQQLGNALKNIDEILNNNSLNADQQNIIQALDDSLTSAGSLLRDLIFEHNSLNNHLRQLAQQQTDLEDEYTRLVEHQLGE